MAEVAGNIRTNCMACGAEITPVAEHKRVTVKLNGTNGQWPDAEIVKGNLIRAAFAKNAGAFAELASAYRMPNIAPQPGNRYVAYMQFWVTEEPITE